MCYDLVGCHEGVSMVKCLPGPFAGNVSRTEALVVHGEKGNGVSHHIDQHTNAVLTHDETDIRCGETAQA